MLIFLAIAAMSLMWAILGAIIDHDSGVYRPHTRKAKTIHTLLLGPALWAGYLVALLIGIPVYFFQKFSKWVGRKMREANNQGEAKYSPRRKCYNEQLQRRILKAQQQLKKNNETLI